MQNLPNTLVETWLLLAIDTTEENREARQMATQNIMKVFGNIDTAQIYLNNKKGELSCYLKKLKYS